MHIQSFSNYRAIAIFLIVAGHFLGQLGPQGNSFIEKILVNLIQGGTALFVFISGFLFHHIFYEKFKYKKFLISKFKNVLIPYIILGSLAVVIQVISFNDKYNGFFLPTSELWFYKYIVPTIKYYLTGGFLAAYWYVPFILVTFLLSPLHIRFISCNSRIRFLVIFLFALIAITIHRPIGNLSVPQSVLYYTPLYLFGIVASIHREEIYDRFHGKEGYLLLLCVFISSLQVFNGDVGNYHKSMWSVSGLDFMFIQKNVLCLFFMVLLHRFEHVNNKWLNLTANTSFAIFFLHPYILTLFEKSHLQLFENTYFIWVGYLTLVCAVIIICILLALMVKKIFKKNSRYLIGY